MILRRKFFEHTAEVGRKYHLWTGISKVAGILLLLGLAQVAQSASLKYVQMAPAYSSMQQSALQQNSGISPAVSDRPLSVKASLQTHASGISAMVDGVAIPALIVHSAPSLPIAITAPPPPVVTPPLPSAPANSSVNPQPAPVGHNNEGAAEEVANPALAQSPSSTGGNLLGAPLPPVPVALHLLVADEGAQQQSSPHELVAVTASMDDAKVLAQVMQSYQARIVRRRKLGSLGMVISSFRLPDKVSVSETLRDVRKKYSDLWVDMNHYFHPLTVADKHRTSLYKAIGLHGPACGRNRRLGILDGPVDMQHPALHGQSVVQEQIITHGQSPASFRHATAVVSLLVGRPEVPGFGGVISEASVYVGVVMQTGKQGKVFSSVENLLAGLDWLLSQQVQVISLSLGGPYNALLDVALKRTMGMGVGVVAAAGNGGSHALPSYPAAQAGVVAVTAVDRNNVVASDASRGDYIDIAAPGVDVWVVSPGGGGRYTSGSSVAAPLVAAALVQIGGGSSMYVEKLFRLAKDLGPPGKDPLYGWGMVQFPVCSYP